MTTRDFPPAFNRTLPTGVKRGLGLDVLIVFGVILAACLFGIATRPAGLLAAIWPANALLLGLFIRHPGLATPAGWAAAVAAYLVADVATGSQFQKAMLLTAGNLLPVIVGLALYAHLQDDDRRLRRPFSVLYLTVISAVAAAAGGLVGAVANPMLFNGGAFEGWLFWFVSELVNFIVLLPVVLTLPAPRWPSREDLQDVDNHLLLSKSMPLAALVASCLASHWIGGPGAVAFPVPALLWCALVFNVAGTAFVTLLFSAWTLIGISTGALPVGTEFSDMSSIMSVRIGVALMALAPLNVASVMAARNEFQFLLQRMVTNDPLTAALNRRAFSVRTRNQLGTGTEGRSGPVSMLLFDIDRFKHINALHGHAAGDQALKALARAARAYLPNADDLGRLGSDELAILLFDCNRTEAARHAARVATAFSEIPISLDDGGTLRATVSVGIATTFEAPPTAEPLLTEAEGALWQARHAGGNQSAFADAAM